MTEVVHSNTWARVTAVGWLVLLMVAISIYFTPTSVWFEVTSIHVEDSVVGDTPVMVVDRVIHRDFSGEWLAEVERINANGKTTPVCVATGRDRYNDTAVYPDPLTLDWWTFPMKCFLPTGAYRLETTWTLEIPIVGQRVVVARSNRFEVRAASW